MTEASSQPPAMAESSPDPDQVRAALARLKEREPFRSAPQLAAFLTYVVEEKLAGRSSEIKGYSIATLALGRPESFDPQTDPIVRVQAGRVRQALAEYDATHADEIVISLPKGSYIPVFHRRSVPTGISTPAVGNSLGGAGAQAQTKSRSKRSETLARQRLFMAGLVGFLAVSATLIILYASGHLRRDPMPVAYVPPTIFPEIIIDESYSGHGAEEAAIVAERLRDAIARFDDVVAVHEQVDQTGASLLPRPKQPSDLLRLRLFVTDAQPGFKRYTARLVEQHDQSVIWSREFDVVPAGPEGEEARSKIIRQIATTIAQPYGVVHGYTRRMLPPSSYADTPYRCLLSNFEYQLVRSKKQHEAALACIDDNLQRFPGVAALHAQKALFLVEAYRFGYLPTRTDLLDQALKAARLSVRLAPGSARSYAALFVTQFVRKELSAAWRAGNKAIELNPFDTDIQAEFGARLVLSGQVTNGLAMIDTALEYNSAPPPSIMTIKAFGLHMIGRLEEALALSESLKWTEFSLAMMGRIVLARVRGDRQDGELGLRIIRETHPTVIADVSGYLDRSNVEPGMAARANDFSALPLHGRPAKAGVDPAFHAGGGRPSRLLPRMPRPSLRKASRISALSMPLVI